jgi:hypothetical protein
VIGMSGFDDGGATPPPPPPPSAGGGGAIPPRGLGDILSAAFEVYRANAAKLITIVAVVVIPLTFLTALFTSMLSNNVQDVATSLQVDPSTGQITSSGSSATTSAGNAILLTLLVALLSFLIQYLLTGALTRGAASSVLGRDVDVQASYGYAFSRLLPLIGLAILVGIVVALGFVLLIIPGIIFLVFLSMAVPAFVVERLGITASMSRSWNLVKGYWWHTLGVIVVTWILAAVVTRVLSAIGGTSFVGVWITSALGQIITAPFVALVTVLLYVDLRSRHEGLTAPALSQELDAAP